MSEEAREVLFVPRAYGDARPVALVRRVLLALLAIPVVLAALSGYRGPDFS